MKAPDFDYRRPATLDAALELLGEGESARLLAGGQSLCPMLNYRMASPALLVDVSRLAELAGARLEDGDLVVGACVRHAEIEDGRIADATAGLLPRAAGGIAYRAVRNRGTIGGSLAHADPAGDWAPVLMALDAVALLASRSGRREVPLASFITGPLATVLAGGEILCRLRIPGLSPAARWGHCKLCLKPGEFAQALAVVVVDGARLRAVVASPRHPPVYLPRVEALIGESGGWSQGLAESVRDAVARDLGERGLADDAYELQLRKVAVARAAAEALQ